ncbi:MAG: nucleoside deaminase [Clostridia bacterium]|nr:nucleoside deaminase [Clostridia bacterium]
MRCALDLAAASLEFGEVPVGAVMVRGGKIVAADFNGRESEKNALYHAEVAVIGKTCRAMGGWRLPGCELYVTLEPCIMCTGAIFQARVPRLIFGAADPKAGFFGGIANACDMPLNHKINVKSGVLAEEASRLLEEFFTKKR